MESIIEQLYVLELDKEIEKSDLSKDEEYITYEKLRKSLTKEQKTEFDKFVDLYGDRLIVKQEKMYKSGFKAAYALIKEISE